jgi:iron complex transport system substrate-binding protein
MNHNGTELFLALGLEDRMVGTAWKDHAILPRFREEYDSIPVLSEQYPSLEVLLDADPDFVYGWRSAFQPPQGPATIQRLEELGMTPYMDRMYADTSIELEDVYEEIKKIGLIFQIEDRSDSLVEKMKRDIAKIQESIPEDSKPIEVVVYSDGTDSFYGSGTGLVSDLLQKINARNVLADDIPDPYGSISWEKIVEEDPQYFVILDFGSTPYEQKKKTLKSKSSLADVRAVRAQNFIRLPLSATFIGIRNIRALQTLAEGLYPQYYTVPDRNPLE